jgi:hypothetical protein
MESPTGSHSVILVPELEAVATRSKVKRKRKKRR